MVTIDVCEDGYREVVGRTEDFTECKECWHGFLSWPKSRGLRGIRVLTGDKAYRKAEISHNTAYSHLAKNDPSRPEHPSAPRSCVRARGHQRTRLNNRNVYAQHRLDRSTYQDMPSSTHANPICKLLGGFADRISPKHHPAPTFPQVGEADSEQPRRKPHRSQGPMAKSAPISCGTTQNPQGAPADEAAATAIANAGATPDIAANAPPSLLKNASSDDNARDHFAVSHPSVLTFARFKLPRRRCIKERTATDARAGMRIGLICACSYTNACTGYTTNHRAKALMENARGTPYLPLQIATPSTSTKPLKKSPTTT